MSGSGKMGRTLVEAFAADPSLEPVGVVDKLATVTEFGLASGTTLPLFADTTAAIDTTNPDVIVDFTNAAWTPVLAEAALARNVRLVIGTTGLDQAWVEELRRRCAETKTGAVLAANFALGAVLMMHMAKIAAPFFESAEIIEMHHDQKVDAPSGTSLATAHGMLEARDGRAFSRNEPESTPVEGTRTGSVDGITIHSVRLPGYVAHQEVIFGAAGQTLTIRHDSNRESYIPGVLLAIREVMAREELVVGLDRIMGLA